MGSLRAACVQLRIEDAETPSARLARVLALIEGLSGRADLVVLPELWLSGAFATRTAVEVAEPLDGPTFAALSDAAKSARLHVLAGSLSEAHGDKPFNTAVVYGPTGERLALYRKIHLFGFDGGESKSFSPGPPQPVVWDSPWGRLGLATCYDLRFPELFRALVDDGALGFLVPTGWPTRRIDRWDLLARARAIENQAWLIGVNAVGTHAGFDMGGHSVVVNPTGDVTHLLGEDEEVVVVDVDPIAAQEWRQKFPALSDRRL